MNSPMSFDIPFFQGLRVSWTEPSGKVFMNCKMHRNISEDAITNEPTMQFLSDSPCGVVETNAGASLSFLNQNTQSFPPGVYTCKVSDGGLQLITKTFNVSLVKFASVPIEAAEISLRNAGSVVKTFKRDWPSLSTETLQLRWIVFMADSGTGSQSSTSQLLVKSCELEIGTLKQCSENKYNLHVSLLN